MNFFCEIIRNSKFTSYFLFGFLFLNLFSVQPGFSQTTSSVVFRGFDFGELRGPIAHETFAPISGDPIAGVSQTAVATLTGSFDTATFRLVSLTGNVIKTLNLKIPLDDGSRTGFGEFIGNFTPPNEPFQVVASGQDTSGASYSILIPKIFTPQTVEVSFDRTSVSKSGSTSTLFIDVTNHGNSDSFSIDVADIAIEWSTHNPRGDVTGLVTRISPSSFSLSKGATKGIEVDIKPPSGTPVDTGVILTAVVTNNSNVSNRDIFTFPVVLDTTPPKVTAPSNKTVASAGPLTAVSIGQATATDNVGVFSLSNNSNGLFPVGVNEVTWVALDAAGNLGTAIQTVNVTGTTGSDTIPPVVIPPPDVSVQAIGTQTLVDLGTATATDNVSPSGNIFIANNAPASFPVGVTSVVWTATDEAGNSGTGIQTVTVAETGGNQKTVLDIRVSASSDDAEEQTTGSVLLSSSDLEFMEFSGGGNQKVGMRFQGVTIPNCSAISNAYIQFQVDETDSGAASLIIEGENAASPLAFSSTSGNITSRQVTTASVPWSPAPWTQVGEAGANQQTTNIASVIQEIVNLPDWTSGNPLAVIISGTGKRTAESYNGSRSAAPLLHVEYGAGSCSGGQTGSGAGDTTPPIVTAPADVAVGSTGSLTPVDIGEATATDNVGVVLLTNDLTGASLPPSFPVGTTVVTWRAEDAAGNVGTDTQTVTVTEAGVIKTLDIRVSSSSDDAEEQTNGSILLKSSDLEFMEFSGGGNQKVGMRFQGVNIPSGATITNAYIQFQVDETDSVETSLTIHGEGTANPAAFVKSTGNITSRPLTSASVPWFPVPWTQVGEAGVDQRTPDITPIIQEIINLPDWANGNSLVVMINGTGQRTAESFNGVSSAAPLLHLEYSTDPVVAPPSGSATPLDIRISSSSDDAEEKATGSVSLASSDLEFTLESGGSQNVGMRFRGVGIPNCSTITNAYVQFQVDEVTTGATALTLRGENAAVPAGFVKSTGNITSRSLTTASVPWSPAPWTQVGEAGVDQQTPNIATIIEEIINLPGWAPGNPLAIIVSGTGKRTAESYNGVSSAAPLLHVEYVASPCN